MGYKNQLLAFLKRNFILKKRNRFQTIQEIYHPFMLILVMVLLSFIIKTDVYDNESYDVDDFKMRAFYINRIFISPNNYDTQLIGNKLKDRIYTASIKYYNSSKDIRDAYLQNYTSSFRNDYGIAFDEDNFPFKYTLYTKFDSNLFDGSKIRLFGNGVACRNSSKLSLFFKDCQGNKYAYNGLSMLQYFLNDIILQEHGKSLITLPNIKMQNMPKGKYIGDQVFSIISTFYFSILYMASLITFVTNVVSEKEKKIKETMQMMGMYDSAFWLSWLLIYFIPFTAINLILTIILIAINFFRTIVFAIIFLILMQLFACCTLAFGMIFTTFFRKSKTASAACSLVFTIAATSYLPIAFVRQSGTNVSITVQWFLSLLFPCALSLAIDQGLYGQAIYGNKFPSKMLTTPIQPNSMSILDCTLMLLIDLFLYFIIAIYLDNVIPGEFGRAKSPIFCFMPSYWKNKNAKLNKDDEQKLEIDNENYEQVHDSLKDFEALKIQNLVKSFKKDGKYMNAVDGISLSIYEGQITAIIGHNGAGKTTLFNILCGLLAPTSGTATFYQYNLLSPNDLEKVRKMSGICLQDDVLYDNLNCEEHLELYASLKDVPRDQIHSEVISLLRKVDLIDSKSVLARNLSGGQKRKLSVAIALIGDPKLVILDEPTSGMDPQSRRLLWTLLQNMKNDRVILLATHFMDEADILGDRKAVVIKGKIRCVGSSLFLKNKFGIGYHLNLVRNSNFTEEPKQITKFILKHVNNAKLEKYQTNEISYTLPSDSVSYFPGLFKSLENHSKSIGIDSIGISMTTLEEVFLKLGQEDENDAIDMNSNLNIQINKEIVNEQKEPIGLSNVSLGPKPRYKNINTATVELIKTRLRLAYRNKITFTFRFILPVFYTILSILFQSFLQKKQKYNPNDSYGINLNINEYASNSSKFLLLNNTGGDLSTEFIKNLIVNDKYLVQPFEMINDLNLVNITQNGYSDYSSGIIINKWINPAQNNLIVAYNDSALLSLPFLINVVSNLYARIQNIQIFNASLGLFPTTVCDLNPFDGSAFTSVLMLGFTIVTPVVSFAIEVVHDKELKCQSKLKFSGCNFWQYWGTCFIAYIIQYSITPILLFLLIGIIPTLRIAAFGQTGAIINLVLLFMIYMPSLILSMFCFTFVFQKKETATSVLNIIVTLLFMVPYMITSLSQIGNSKVSDALHIIFTIIDPIYGLIGAIYKINQVYITEILIDCALNSNNNHGSRTVPIDRYFEFEKYRLPLSLIIGLLHLFFFGGLLYYLDSLSRGINLFNKVILRKPSSISRKNYDVIQEEDVDIKKERERVHNLNRNQTPVVLQEIRKEYKIDTSFSHAFSTSKQTKRNFKTAVRNFTFGLNTGEVFGLLGPNGAGKSTIMNIIAAETIPDCGYLRVFGEAYNLNSLQRFYEIIGYCPQYNPLWDDLTLMEHLKLYAAIRGIPKEQIDQHCKEIVDLLQISEHVHKKSAKLSGGTKRKLIFAMSLFGSPKIGLLDEPSTGMDPQSKRIFWNLIKIFFDSDKCAILTTHSMEEVEALCSRIGIMVKGQLKCLGSSQYLKDKYCMGYLLEAKINQSEQTKFVELINSLFNNNFVVTQQLSNHYVYQLPKQEIGFLAKIFFELEYHKALGVIQEYSFSQCTFEQVFIEFAKKQDEAD